MAPPRVEQRDQLRYVKKGDPVSARAFNALVDFARGRGVPPGAGDFSDAAGSYRRREGRSPDDWLWFRCDSDVDADPYSILEVYAAALDADGPVLSVREATAGATRFAGNEHLSLVAATPGWVKLVNPTYPVEVRASSTVSFLDELSPDGFEVGPGSDLIALTSSSDVVTGTGDSAGRHVMVIAPTRAATEEDAVIVSGYPGTAPCNGTGTGTCPPPALGTGSGETECIAVYRTSHPGGVCVRMLNCDGSEECAELRVYPAPTMRGVHYTLSAVRVAFECGEWRILSHGDWFWGSAVTQADIAAGSSGPVELFADGPVVTAHTDTAVAAGTACDVSWDDEAQQFKITAQRCPPAP